LKEEKCVVPPDRWGSLLISTVRRRFERKKNLSLVPILVHMGEGGGGKEITTKIGKIAVTLSSNSERV